MNTLYIDGRMGVSGIKLLGALVDLMEQPYEFTRQFNDIGFEGMRMESRSDALNEIAGTRVEFTRTESSDDPYADESDDYDDDDIGGIFPFGKKKHQSPREYSQSRTARRGLSDVKEIIGELKLSGKVRNKAIEIYERIAQAASVTHNKDIEEVTLHRAGARDVIASVVGACMILEELNVDKIMASPVTVGTGYITGSAGSTPIPTPTVKLLLEDIPYTGGKEEGELCTLEGAAILSAYVNEFIDAPDIAILKTGTGIGNRSYKTGSNCTRVSIGRLVKTSANATVSVLSSELFNDSADVLRLCGEKLKELGVMEAYTVPIADLLGGNGVELRCICKNDLADDAASIIIKYTSSVFVRRSDMSGYRMELVPEKKETHLGELVVQKATGFGTSKVIIDRDDVEKIAREQNLSMADAWYRLRKDI